MPVYLRDGSAPTIIFYHTEIQVVDVVVGDVVEVVVTFSTIHGILTTGEPILAL